MLEVSEHGAEEEVKSAFHKAVNGEKMNAAHHFLSSLYK